jgi:hypothetical protein
MKSCALLTVYNPTCIERNEDLGSRILKAREAIEQQLLVPIEVDGPEYRELTAARNALELLKSERVDKIERPHTFASSS